MRHLVAFIIGLFLIAAFLRIDFFFYLLYIFFGIYALSRFWTDRALRSVQVSRDFVRRAFLGEHLTVKLHVRNEGWLPLIWLRIHESLPVQLKAPNFFRCVLSLLPRESTTLTYDLECRKRGYYPIGPLHISTGDPFGTRQLEKRLDGPDAVMVYPKIVPLTEMGLPSQTPFGDIAAKQRIFEDPARMIGVRDYTAGDSLRHIHWKTSATTGRLQVKRFEPAISIQAGIFLNLNRDEYTPTRLAVAPELAIVAAASVANHLVEKRQTVGLCCNGLDPLAAEEHIIALPPRPGREQLMHILDVLARVQTSDRHSFGETLRLARLHLTWGGTGIIVTSHASDELFANMLMMKRSGFHVVLILLDPKVPFDLTKERAHKVGIRAYQVWQESDLDVWR